MSMGLGVATRPSQVKASSLCLMNSKVSMSMTRLSRAMAASLTFLS